MFGVVWNWFCWFDESEILNNMTRGYDYIVKNQFLCCATMDGKQGG